MSIAQLKKEMTAKLKAAGDQMNEYDMMQASINTRSALATIKRYTSGKEKEVRRLELAEVILNEVTKIIEAKNMPAQ